MLYYKVLSQTVNIVLHETLLYIVRTKASQCGYVVSASASRQGDPGSNPIAVWKSCEVFERFEPQIFSNFTAHDLNFHGR